MGAHLRIVPLCLLLPLLQTACLLAPVSLADDQLDLFALRALLTAGSGAYGATAANSLRGRFYDVNGDGYHDLLLGDEAAGGSAGRALIYHGSASGVGSFSVGAGGTGADTILTGPVASAFGHSVTLGDINGDGYADAVVGADNHNANRGAVYIFYSQGSGGIASQDLQSGSSAGTTLTGENASDQFGDFVDVGDYNGDGYADVLTGAWGYSANAGRIYVFFGSASGIASGGAAGADTILTGTNSNRLTGAGNIKAVFGDVNGDGFDDVHVCSVVLAGPQLDLISFYSSGAAGSVDLGAGGSPDATIASGTLFCQRGVAAGDVNGDGYADLLTADGDLNGNDGEAYVFQSSGPSGITATAPSQADSTFNPVAGASCRFGLFVNFADVNSDGLSDAIIGETNGGCTPDYYYMFYSTGSGIPSQNLNSGGSANSILGEATGNFIGFVGSGDFNGDGFEDLVSTIPSGGGLAWIFYGTASGIASGDSSSAGTTLSNITTTTPKVPR